jgi:hypothetical protein
MNLNNYDIGKLSTGILFTFFIWNIEFFGLRLFRLEIRMQKLYFLLVLMELLLDNFQ